MVHDLVPRCAGGGDRPMTAQERQMRDQIAAEIVAQFGSLAPYKLVAEFVRKGTKV